MYLKTCPGARKVSANEGTKKKRKNKTENAVSSAAQPEPSAQLSTFAVVACDGVVVDVVLASSLKRVTKPKSESTDVDKDMHGKQMICLPSVFVRESKKRGKLFLIEAPARGGICFN